jgi:hypothetical protein
MTLRRFAAMLSTVNDYSLLRWPLLLLSVLITLLALMLLLSFRSYSWFTYEVVLSDGIPKISDDKISYSSILEYGSFGLWVLCTNPDADSNILCDTYTRQTRPRGFSVIIILSSISLILANLTIFPCWAALILVLYNVNNRYIRHIMIFTWLIFILALAFTCLLIGVLIMIGLSKFYSPGRFTLDTKQMLFYVGPGVIYMLICKKE